MELKTSQWQYVSLALVATAVLPYLRETNVQLISRSLLSCLAAWYLLSAINRMIIYPFYVSPLRRVPGPTNHHFLFGQTINQFRTGDPREPYLSWVRKWPTEPFVRFIGLGNTETLLVTQLDTLKEVFQSNASAFMKPELTRRIQTPVMGKGIVFTEGDEHRADRKLFSPTFSLNKIKRLIPIIQYKAKQLTQHLSQLTEQQTAIIDVSSMWSRVTLDIIAYYTTGTDMSITLELSVFHDSYQEAFDPSAFGQLLMLISGFFPAVRLIPFQENRKFNSARERIRSEIRKIIRERMSELSEESAEDVEKLDLLSHMISESRATGQPWSEEKMFENTLNFFGAGHETSATALVWTIHALTLHPDIQDRLRKDVLELLERKPNPDFVDLESLAYLDKVLKETLRLYNPGISTGREPMHDVEVCGILIPKGTTILCMPTVLNQNHAIWGPDVDEFKPERWDNLAGQAADPVAMTSFLLGPRSCIGRAFSMLEMKILLVEVLSKFRFEAAVEEKDLVLMNPSLTLRVQGGLKVRVSRL